MNATKWLCSAAMVGTGILSGCAHEQVKSTTDTLTAMTRPEAGAKQAPQAVPEVHEQMAADLRALLQGSKIHFGFNEDNLTRGSEVRLQALAEKLSEYPNTKILISGNCDERGTEDYNLALGQRRADVARAYLVKLGVDVSRIQTVSYGFERPTDPAHNEDAWATNRRDELLPQAAN